jgi:hypothetical protein
MNDIIEWQKPDGKQWEERIIERINKASVYIPRDVVHADKIITLDRRKLISYVQAEGYGK